MAEPFSIATGALQVAGAGFQVVKTLAAYIQAVNGFDKSVAAIQLEVKVTSSTLESLSTLLNDHEAENICSTKIVGDAQQVFRGCFAAFDEVDQAFRNVVKTGNDGKRPSFSAGARLKWPLRKGKVETLQANLERLKTTLLLMLSVMSFAREKARSDAKRAFLEKLQIKCLMRSEELARERYGALAARLDAAEKNISESGLSPSSRAIDQGPGTPQDADNPGSSDHPNQRSSLLEHLEACTSAVANLTHALDSARQKYIAQSLFQLQDVDLPWQALGTVWGRLEAFDGERMAAISESSIQHCDFDPPAVWDNCMEGEGSVVPQKGVDGRWIRGADESSERNTPLSPELGGGEIRLTPKDHYKASSTGTEQPINEPYCSPSPMLPKSESTPEHQNLVPMKEDGLDVDRPAKSSRPLIRHLSRGAINRFPRRQRRRPQDEGPPLLRRRCDSNIAPDISDFELELEDAESSKENASSASSSSSPSRELSTTPSRPEPQPHPSPPARVPSTSPSSTISGGSSETVDRSPQDSQQDPPEKRRYAHARNNMKPPPSTLLIKRGEVGRRRIACRVVLKTDRLLLRESGRDGEKTEFGAAAPPTPPPQEEAGRVGTAEESAITEDSEDSGHDYADDGMEEVDALINRWTTLQV
ncbi:hypothetical protein NU219Hw_g6454t1 [Hortaea werneckii]